MKKAMIFVVPLLVLGAVAGLGVAGIIHIPGLSPAKKKGLAAGQYSLGKDLKPPEAAKKDTAAKEDKAKPPPQVKAEVVKVDPVVGQKKLAALWTAMETSTLAPIVSGWKDPELAPVLARMDPEKVAELLGSLKADRASALCKAIQKEASSGKK